MKEGRAQSLQGAFNRILLLLSPLVAWLGKSGQECRQLGLPTRGVTDIMEQESCVSNMEFSSEEKK